jgi:hypothetical protein
MTDVLCVMERGWAESLGLLRGRKEGREFAQKWQTGWAWRSAFFAMGTWNINKRQGGSYSNEKAFA